MQDGLLNIKSCHDPEKTADVIIRVLPHPKHQKHIKEMGLAPT